METLQPKLRFPEFAEKYINKRVDDFAPLQRGFDLPITKMVKGKFPVVFSNGISKTHNEFKVKAPGIVTGRSGTIGNLFYIEENFWPHNTSLWVTDFKGNFPKYVYYFYDKFDLKRFGTGSGVPTLNRNDVHNQQIYIPSPEEQTKIAIFLSSVDEKLKLLKEKKALLEEYKKGSMQKIFNQEIRFKDDNGEDFEEWEEKNLGEVTSITIGEFVIKTRQNPNGKYPVYNGGKSCTGYYDEFNNDGNKIVISARGANAGFVNFEKGKFWAGNSCYSVGVLDKYHFEIIYFYYYVKFNENTFTKNQQAANIPSVSKKDVEKFSIKIPSLEEQTKIANFLSAIDEKIELVFNQIQDTQEYKKGLLQQMFV